VNGALTHTAPWSTQNPPEAAQVSYLLSLEVLRVTGICLQPFISEAAHNLLNVLGVVKTERSMDFAAVGEGNVGEVMSGCRYVRLTLYVFSIPLIPAQ
jgi:methionyl-tRNA synthetase